MDTINIYDHKKTYETELKPIISELKKICVQHGIPCFVCVATSNSETKASYEYDGVLPGFLDLKLHDDQFAKHLCVANGFDIKPVGVADDFSDVADFIADIPEGMFDSYTEEIPE